MLCFLLGVKAIEHEGWDASDRSRCSIYGWIPTRCWSVGSVRWLARRLEKLPERFVPRDPIRKILHLQNGSR